MNIPILSVRDDEGNIIPIPAIKGEPGKDYVLTDADKQEIANLIGGVTPERPTETKEFLNTYVYKPNADVSFDDGKALLICAGFDELNNLLDKEIIKIEMNLDYENWIDVKDLITLYPKFPYAINMNRSFEVADTQGNRAVCFGVLGFVESGGNTLLTDINFHNQYGFRVTYYTD